MNSAGPANAQMRPLSICSQHLRTVMHVTVDMTGHLGIPRWSYLIPASDAAPRRLRLRSANLNRLNVRCCRRHSTQLVDIFYHIRQVAACVAKLVLGVHSGPPFWERRGRNLVWVWSAIVPFERAMMVSYRFSMWPLRSLPSNVCDAQVNKGGSLWGKV